MELDNLSLLQAVFESTGDGLLIVNNSGTVIQFNSRFQLLWKIPPEVFATKNDEELLGHILGQILYPEKFISKVVELYQDSEAISHDHIEFKDGRFFERYSRPLKMGQSSVGRVWSFRDVTEQKKTQEVFGAITALSPDVISIINSEGKIIFSSSASERIHGHSPEELFKSTFLNLVMEEDKLLVKNFLSSLLANPGTLDTIQYRYLNKDKSFQWVETTAVNQIQNPLIQGVVAISRGIGKRKKLEQDLNDALRLRDEFISIASHEFKTPISAIKLQVEMMLRDQRLKIPEYVPDKKFLSLDNLLDQVQYMQRLIDDLLSVSRIRTGQLSLFLERENFSELVRNVAQKFSEMLKEAGCDLELLIDSDINVDCDKIRMEQVLVNLISNAVKYAPGAPVTISITQDGQWAIFKIKDQGPGISADKHDIIFGLFERGTASIYVSGLGIGLFISKNIVENHQGLMSVASESNQGSTFTVKLPLVLTSGT